MSSDFARMSVTRRAISDTRYSAQILTQNSTARVTSAQSSARAVSNTRSSTFAQNFTQNSTARVSNASAVSVTLNAISATRASAQNLITRVISAQIFIRAVFNTRSSDSARMFITRRVISVTRNLA